jgi:nucleoside-diphosphate-sugar epimerase
MAYKRNFGIEPRIARFHNIYGVEGTWEGGREKAPAALCRKIASAPDGGEISLFGDGKQTRSFLYVDDCVEGILRLMQSDFTGPVNVGSEEMISINDFAYMIMKIAGKKLRIKHIPGPLGVRGRSSDNKLIRKTLAWEPNSPLIDGITKTYHWINKKVYRV